MMSDRLKTLAQAVAHLGDAEADAHGQLAVLTCAVAALVRAHPEPQKFAAEFWRSWQLAGSPLADREADDPARAGIVQVLEVLEEACAVPLKVRPGR